MRFLTLFLATTLMWAGFTISPVFAATEVTQRLATTFGGETYQAKHVWSIDKEKFRLDISSADNATSYIFNGRVFYICSALDKKQINFLKENNITAPSIVNKFKNGACQIVPSNFMARFFLSPTDAVESIDRTDALRLTLTLPAYKATSSKQKKSAQKCDSFARNYTLTKAVAGTKENYATTADEQLCLASALDWREGLWREVMKTILRQPGGGKMMATLKQDHQQLKGLAVFASIRIDQQVVDGKKISGTRELTTQSVKTVSLPKDQFSIPKGFEIFSSDGIARDIAAAENQGKEKRGKQKASVKQREDGGLPSILLCAISGSFICLK